MEIGLTISLAEVWRICWSTHFLFIDSRVFHRMLEACAVLCGRTVFCFVQLICCLASKASGGLSKGKQLSLPLLPSGTTLLLVKVKVSANLIHKT
jgi:hypothetical protein